MAIATQYAIWKAADDFNADGVRPTLAAIRKRLGAGSFTTISQAMIEWRRHQELKEKPIAEPVPEGLFHSAHEMVAAIWRAARLAADQAFVGEREALAAELAIAQDDAREAIHLADSLTTDLEQLRQQLTDAADVEDERARLALTSQHMVQARAEELRKATEMAAQYGAEAKEARASERVALDRAARAEGQIEALESQLSQLTAALASQQPITKA